MSEPALTAAQVASLFRVIQALPPPSPAASHPEQQLSHPPEEFVPYDPYVTLEPPDTDYDPEMPGYEVLPEPGAVVRNFEVHLLEKVDRLTFVAAELADLMRSKSA